MMCALVWFWGWEIGRRTEGKARLRPGKGGTSLVRSLRRVKPGVGPAGKCRHGSPLLLLHPLITQRKFAAVVVEMRLPDQSQSCGCGIRFHGTVEVEDFRHRFRTGSLECEYRQPARVKVRGQPRNRAHGLACGAVEIAEDGRVASGWRRAESGGIGFEKCQSWRIVEAGIQRGAIHSGDGVASLKEFAGHAPGAGAEFQPLASFRERGAEKSEP